MHPSTSIMDETALSVITEIVATKLIARLFAVLVFLALLVTLSLIVLLNPESIAHNALLEGVAHAIAKPKASFETVLLAVLCLTAWAFSYAVGALRVYDQYLFWSWAGVHRQASYAKGTSIASISTGCLVLFVLLASYMTVSEGVASAIAGDSFKQVATKVMCSLALACFALVAVASIVKLILPPNVSSVLRQLSSKNGLNVFKRLTLTDTFRNIKELPNA